MTGRLAWCLAWLLLIAPVWAQEAGQPPTTPVPVQEPALPPPPPLRVPHRVFHREVPFTVNATSYTWDGHAVYLRRIDISEVGRGTNGVTQFYHRTFPEESLTLSSAHPGHRYYVVVTWMSGRVYQNTYTVGRSGRSIYIYTPI